MPGISMSQIQINASAFDAEQLHSFIITSVKNGEYDTCLEALSDYSEKNDLDISKINKYISPALRCILLKEAKERNLLVITESAIPDNLFS